MNNPNTIRRPHFEKYRHSRFLRFIDVLVELCDASDIQTAKITDEVSVLRQSYQAMQRLLNKNRSSLLTPSLKAADARRDAAISGIRIVLRGMELHFEEATKQAAIHLGNLIDRHGKRIARMKYVEQTEVTFAILAEINRSPDLVAAANLVGLSTWLEELRLANEEFDELYIKRTKEYAAASRAKMKEFKATTIVHYKRLAALLTAHSLVITPSASYDALIKELNSHIELYNKGASPQKSI